MSQTATNPVSEIGLRFTDGSEPEYISLPAGTVNPGVLQDRVDNLFRSEFQAGLVRDLTAYDQDGNEIATISAARFFGQLVGF